MKPIFEILPNILSINTENCELFIEISPIGMSYVVQSKKDDSFCGVSLYNFEKNTTPAEISQEIRDGFLNHSIVNNSFAQVTIIYAFPEFLLVPASLYKPGTEKTLPNLFGDLYEYTVFTEKIKKINAINIYRIPTVILNAVKEEFPDHCYFHQSTLMIRDQPTKSDQLQVIFHHGSMNIMALKKGKLQLIQYYRFETPEDAIWLMLTVSHQFNLENPLVLLGGTVQKFSDLSKKIQAYFPNVEFDQLPSAIVYDQSLKEIPAHYFTYLIGEATCV